jgi:undecaprenyl phosphate-alpha-L-ara4N flippase subunit ArnE
MSEPGNRKIIGIALMLLSSSCVCTGQLFWKLSIRGVILYLCIGFLLYGAGAFSMLAAYKFGSLSNLQPMLCTQYVFTVFIAQFILGEAITISQYVGIAIILLSVLILGVAESQ